MAECLQTTSVVLTIFILLNSISSSTSYLNFSYPESIDDIIAENNGQRETAITGSSATIEDSKSQHQPSTNSGTGTCMPKEAILLLIEKHRKYQDLFNKPSTKKKSIWEKIASDLSGYGYEYTWIQLKNKWNNLLLNYRKTKDANNKTGNSPKTCPFYNELDEYLGCRPNVEPICLMSSIKKSHSVSSTGISNSSSSTSPSSEPVLPANIQDSNDGPTVKPSAHPKKKRQRITPRTEQILAVLEAHETSRKDDNKKLLEEMKSQHNEQMQLEKEKLEVEKSKIEIFRKLIEKK